MSSTVSPARRFYWPRPLTLLVSFVCLAISLPAATTFLPVSVTGNPSVGRVVLPAGTTKVVLQGRELRGGWRDLHTRAAQPGPATFSLSKKGRLSSFRVKVQFQPVSRTKFPAAYYRGKNTFGPSQTTSRSSLDRITTYAASVSVALEDDAADPSSAPAEADIWKISGSTAYFFNHLRGLQVLDLSRPSDPALIASLRLPAVGQDLYLLPSTTGHQDLLLLTTESSTDYATTSTALHVVRVENNSVRILQTTLIPGHPQGSRLLGRRLFLCTTEGNAGRTTLSEWLAPETGEPIRQSETTLSGHFSTLASGPDWLAVVMIPNGGWDRAEVSAFQLGESGLTALSAAPIALAGRASDAYKLQWRSGVLTTISQSWSGGLTTWLETFRAEGPAADGQRLAALELARGETLHATRFAGDKAYVVTFFLTDPLFVIDLANPAHPVIAGEIEVPGWSTHIEPLGDQLFTVGWEDGAVTASLFDVSVPATPTLRTRLALTEGYGYSEANWDPQALSVLPAAGLALVPLTTYGPEGAVHGVRVVDLDLAAGELRPRGLIPGRFEPRRAALVGDVAITLTQRTLATATLADRDHPEILADTLLAWPVNRTLPVGDRVLAVETGGSWSGGLPTIRTSPLTDPDTVLAELDLAPGYVHDVALREGKLYVLRETSDADAVYARFWRAPLGQLHLDIYDATDPLALRLLGSCPATPEARLGATSTGRLLWPRPDRPAVIVENQPYFWFLDHPIVFTSPEQFLTTSVVARKASLTVTATDASLASFSIPVIGMPWLNRGQAHLITFDVSNPSAPSASAPLALGTNDTTLAEVRAAAEGLLVVGLDQWRTLPGDKDALSSEFIHSAQIVEVPSKGAPAVRKPIDLPGSLFAVGELGRDGFIAYTRTYTDTGDVSFQASACDGYDAFLVTQTAPTAPGIAIATNRTLFHATSQGIQRLRLSPAGKFIEDGLLETNWTPNHLRVVNSQLLASDWRRLLAAPLDATVAPSPWTFSLGFQLEDVTPAADGAWLVPFGDYGFELARP